MRTKDLIRIIIVISDWIFGNPCELRILYVFLLVFGLDIVIVSFFGLDIWKPMRTKDLIRIVIVFGLDIWKLVRTKHLIRIVIVFRLGYLETRVN